MTPAGFPHSDIPGSQLGCQLPRAYRRLLRPSSALDAKASTMCPSQLATTNTTPHPPTIKSRHDTPATSKKSQSQAPLAAAHYKDARVHYPDLKQQPHTSHPPGHNPAEDLVGQLNHRLAADAPEPQQCAPAPTPDINPTGIKPGTRRGDRTMVPLVNTTMSLLHASRPTTGQATVGVCAP